MESKTAKLEIQDDLIILRIHDRIVEELDEVKANLELVESLKSDLQEIKLLIIPGKDGGIAPSAREFVTKRMQVYGAVAFISDSLAKYIIVNHIARFMGMKGRVKVFKSQEKAIIWLKKLEILVETA